MKKLFYFLFSIILLSSCDDGDIIITSFEFDDVDLEICDGSKDMEFVFFKINPTNNEAISFNFIGDYNEKEVTEMPITINLAEDQSSSFIYRQFNSTITNTYYCSNVPAGNIIVTDELMATSGIAEIAIAIVNKDDNDGIPAEDEDVNGNGNLEDDDTDNDGIPNYIDQDDDNDNVLTIAELENGIPDNDAPLDSDEDGIPDYLDNDDDNDGVLTINEDLTENEDGTIGNNNPRDDDDDNNSIPNYLDPNIMEANTTATPNPNSTIVKTTFRTTVNISEPKFDGENQDFEENTDFSFGFRDVISDVKASEL